jgi:hypothetical protein
MSNAQRDAEPHALTLRSAVTKKADFHLKKRNLLIREELKQLKKSCPQVHQGLSAQLVDRDLARGFSGGQAEETGRYLVMSRKLTPRQVIARSYPTWDYAMADRLIAWLQDCGYQIVQKSETNTDVVAPLLDQPTLPELMHAC